MAELEAEGAALVVEGAAALAARHPFLHASPSDLRVVRRSVAALSGHPAHAKCMHALLAG